MSSTDRPAPDRAGAERPGLDPARGSSPVPARTPRPPIRMLHDRVLVRLESESAERLSSSGIVIPATAVVGRRLVWGAVIATGQHVRQVAEGDRVLFDPEDRAEVELGGVDYLLLREKDIHGVAEPEATGEGTGLYL